MVKSILILSLLLITGCNDSNQENESIINTYSVQTYIDTITHVDTIHKTINAFEQFNYYGLKQELLDPDTSPRNKSFVWKLLVSKNQDWRNRYAKPIKEKAVTAVYRFSSNSVGLTTTPIYGRVSNNGYGQITDEYKLYQRIPTSATIEDSLIWYRRVRSDTILDRSKNQPILGYTKMDSLYRLKGQEFYIYGIHKYAKAKIHNFGYYEDDCDFRFYTYLLEENETLDDLNFRPLVATLEPIDIEYHTDSEIDSLIHQDYLKLKSRSDCPARREANEVVYARLKGFPNVYFTYRDKFPYNTEIDYPARGIVQINKESKTINRLWGTSIDYFGCACL